MGTHPPGGSLPLATQVSVTLDSGQGFSRTVQTVPAGTASVAGFELRAGDTHDAVAYFGVSAGSTRDEWLQLRWLPPGSQTASPQRTTGATGYLYGWVPLTVLEGAKGWVDRARTLPQPPYARVQGSGSVPVRIGPSLGYTEYVAQITLPDGWYAIIGQNAAWWQLQVDATTVGWVQASQVAETGERTGVPFVNESPPPALEDPGGSNAPATAATQASGHYNNLANSWQGAWAVSKSGTTVTAAFQSTRSPVQHYARQNPQDLLVLPAGFRPTTTQDIRVTGVHVTITGEDYDQSPQQQFTLRVSTTGAVRYVDHTELDHVGFLRYAIGTAASGMTLTWQTATAATVNTRPTLGDLAQRGNFTNRSVHWEGYWDLARSGNTVTGTFGSTRSAVQYAARQNPMVLFTLPADYRPASTYNYTVTGARHKNEDGTDHVSGIPHAFDLTVNTDGAMRYVDNSKVDHVGFLSYTATVSWTAAARVQVPTAPRNLEAEDVAAETLALDWQSPANNGGADIEGYRIQVYRRGRWRTEESDTDSKRTDYDVEDLDPYTRYSFRVAARNSAGWGPFSTAVEVTTRREAPGRPRSLTARATHERVTLDWRAPASGGTVTGYRVERRVGSGRYRVVAADTGSAVSFYGDANVAAATRYTYRVQALNYGEEGAWSSTKSVTTAAAPTIPGPPTALAVAPGPQSQLQLTWTAPTNTGGGVTGYRVERSPDATPRAWREVVADTGTADPSWPEEGLAADTVYHYRVAACNRAGVSTPSVEAPGQTRPQVRLDQAVRYPLTAHAEPRGDAAATATFPFFVPTRTYDLAGQTPDATGWQQILNFHATQAGPFWVPGAAGSAQGSLAAVPQVPGAPGTFAATQAATSEVTLTWTPPVTGAGVTGYRLWRQPDAGAWVQLGSDLAASARTYTDDTVAVNHAYRYWLQALADPGPGIPAPIQALAVMPTPAAPDPVRNLAARATATTLGLSWQSATTGGLPAEYRVAWRPTDRDSFQQVTVPGTSQELANLRPGRAYELQVTARNQVGETTAVTRTVSTLDAAPGQPTRLAVGVTGNAATATWEAPVDGGTAASYEVQSKARTVDWPTASTSRTVLSQALTNLTFAAAYNLRVRAVNPQGTSAWVTVPFTAGPERPGVVRNLAGAPEANSQLQLTWDRPADDSAITGYRIERSADVDPRVWTAVVTDPGTTDTAWSDSSLAAATVYHYQVTARSVAGLGTVSAEVEARTRPQLQLRTDATYPVQARAWPATEAPATQSWTTHDATVKWDVVGQVSGTDGWWRILRFGASASGPYWLPASAVTVMGSTTDVPTAPGLPTALAATATHNMVTLTWTAPTTGGTVTGYHIWRQTGTESFSLLETDPERTATTYTDLDREAATTYQYRVQALSAAGSGSRTAAVSVTAAATPVAPGAPTGLTAAPGVDSQLQLSWTPPVDADTEEIAGYLVERSAGVNPRAWTGVGYELAATVLTWADHDLDVDTLYHYRVRAFSAAGGGDPSAAAQGRTRPQLALKQDATYPLTAHQWPETTAPVTHTWAAPDDTVQLDVVGQVSGTDGWWRGLRFGERASGPYWVSAAAVTVTGTTTDVPQAPGLPLVLTATATHETVTLTWTAPTSGGTVIGYRLWRQTGNGTLAVLGEELAAAALTHMDTGLATESAYQYRLQALSAAGAGARTAAVAVTTLAEPQVPDAPTDLTAAPGADSPLTLAWTAPTVTVTGYRIERAADVEPRVWVEQVADTGTTHTTWADSGLTADTVYHYQVTGRNAEGLGDTAEATGRTRPRLALLATATYPLTTHAWPLATAPTTHTWTAHDATVALDVRGQAPGWWRVVRYGQSASGPYWLPASAATVTGTTTDLPTAPGVPGDLALQATHATVTLTWTAPATGGPVTGYRLWRQSGEAAFSVQTDALAAAALSHTDTTVTASTAYQYRLQAVSAAGYGLRTAAVGITTAETPRVPGQVTDLTAAPTAESQMSLRWTAPTDPGTQPLTGYQVARAPDAEPRVWTTVVTDTGTTDLTWHDRGLPASTVYHYRVSARSSVGGGTASAAASGTTRPQLTLLATATYPLTAHQWPAATAPVTHTWSAHAATVSLDLVGQGAGGGGWWRGLRFGHTASGPYWLPAAAVGTQGTTSDLPQVPGAPADLAASASAAAVTLSWSAPTTGGPVTGYRLWRQSGEAAFSVQGDDLAADALTYKDTAVTASTTYQYRLQARSAAGWGTRTAAVSATTPAAAAPGVPADVACNYRNGRVTVYWDPPPTGGPVTHYLLWQQIDSGTWAVTGDPVATGRSYYSYRFAAPADADTLAYEVQAVGPGGAGPRSDTTSLIVSS